LLPPPHLERARVKIRRALRGIAVGDSRAGLTLANLAKVVKALKVVKVVNV
jgi:hypothetical protein